MTRLTSAPHELARLQAVWDCEGMGWAQVRADLRAHGGDARLWPALSIPAFIFIAGLLATAFGG